MARPSLPTSLAVLLAAGTFAAALSGCASPTTAQGIQPIAAGDAWTYRVTADAAVRTETVHVHGVQTVSWGNATREAFVTTTTVPEGLLVIDVLADPVTLLGRTWPGEVRVEELWQEGCRFLPSVLEPGPQAPLTCRGRQQGLDRAGDTTLYVEETLQVRFDVGAPSLVAVPAGRFMAFPVTVEFHSDAGDATVPRAPAIRWYAPEACAVVREESGPTVRELIAYRCAASSASGGGMLADAANGQGEGADVAREQADFGPDPVLGRCFLPYSGAGAGVVEVDPFGLDCPLPRALAGGALRSAAALRIEVRWDERTLSWATVHLSAAQGRASGTVAPIVLDLPAAGLDEAGLRASVHADGLAAFDEFELTFRIVPAPAAAGRAF